MLRLVCQFLTPRLRPWFSLIVASLATLAIAIAVFALALPASAGTGDVLRTITVTPAPGCFASPGIAFDGSELLISCTTTNVITRVNPANGVVVGSIPIPGVPVTEGIGGLSWDATNNQLWIGTADVLPQKVYSAMLDKTAGTGTATFRFTHREGGLSIIDGLAFDRIDGTIWLSPDQSPTVFHYDQSGLLLDSFDLSSVLGADGVTGIVVGDATTLFLANDGTGKISSFTKQGTFIAPFATLTDTMVVDLACDAVTFAPKSAIWVKGLIDFELNAFEAPAGKCAQAVTPSPGPTFTALITPTVTPIASPTATPLTSPTAIPQPVNAIDAKVEIIFPHDATGNVQPVTKATLANVGAFLFFSGTRAPLPCAFDGQVRLFRALNSDPSRIVASGEPRPTQQSGFNLTEWEWNDVDVTEAIDPTNRLYFTLSVDGVPTFTNVWAHAADARTIFPEQDVPTGVGALGPEVDAKIEIVFPHDAQGNARPVTGANLVNVGVDVFNVGTLQSAPLDANLMVRLFRSLNNDPQREVAVGQKTIVTTGGVAHPRWVFNDVDVSAAVNPVNKYYFRAGVDNFVTHSNVWAHGADARTIFPQVDTPSQSCQ